MAPSPRVPRDPGTNTGGTQVAPPPGAARTMKGGTPLSFVNGISSPQGSTPRVENSRDRSATRVNRMRAERGHGRSAPGYGNRDSFGSGAENSSSMYGSSSGYGGGMGGMNGMYGMGMGMSMGMFPMMSGMLGNGIISRLYSLQYMVQSMTYMWHMASMNSHLLVQAYYDALKKYQHILIMIRTSEFRRVIQRKCKKSRLFHFLFVVASSTLAAAAVKLIQYYLKSPQNNLLTMGGMGAAGYYGRGSPMTSGASNDAAASVIANQPSVASAARIADHPAPQN